METSIFLLNNVTARPTKIVNRADENWAYFKKIEYFRNQNYFENQNFEMFEEVVHNFGKFDGDIILWKNTDIH